MITMANVMSDKAKAVCIIAWPAGHSRSPLIHNYWIKQHKLNAEYRREAVPPEKFAEFIKHLREHGYIGANVTVPHKQAALALTEPDERAQARSAPPTACGTTATRCARPIPTSKAFSPISMPSRRAGIAAWKPRWCWAPAAAPAPWCLRCSQRGVGRVYVINRTRERAEALQKKFGARVHRRRMGRDHRAARRRRAAGQHHDARHGRPAAAGDQSALPGLAGGGGPGLRIRWKPALLKMARERGLRTADGLGMLLHQAVRGFELWFGVRPEVTPELRALVEADLLQAKAAKNKAEAAAKRRAGISRAAWGFLPD